MAVQEAPVSDWEESTNTGPVDDPSGESAPVEAALDADGTPRKTPGRDDPRGGTPKPAPARQARQAEPEAEDEPEVDPTEESGRDPRGRFRKRSSAQVAKPEDVGRINALTREKRELERRLREVETRTAAPAEERRRPQEAAAPPPPPEPRKFDKARPARPTLRGIQDANPTLDDQQAYAKYESELDKHEQALDMWRDEKSNFEFQERKALEARAAEEQTITTNFRANVAAARKKYPDFDEIALTGEPPWKPGSAIDLWVLKKKYGPDVLYHFQHPDHADELDRILAMDPIDQAEELTLLGQRLNGAPRGKADATTGSSAASEVRPRSPAPKPPNPVRTSAVNRTREDAPGDDGSLEDHERFFGSSPRARRRNR